MKLIFSLFLLLMTVGSCNAASTAADSIPHNNQPAATKGEKWYCSDIAKTKYKLFVTRSKIKITRFYKEFTNTYSGTIKNGKIFSNDPNEKGLKDVWGRYYKLEGKNFGVLNIENGDYEWFAECKR